MISTSWLLMKLIGPLCSRVSAPGPPDNRALALSRTRGLKKVSASMRNAEMQNAGCRTACVAPLHLCIQAGVFQRPASLGLPVVHRREEIGVRLRLRHFREQQLHGLDRG